MREPQTNTSNSTYPEIKDIANDFVSLKDDIGHLGTHIKEDGMRDLSNQASRGYDSAKVFGHKVEAQIKEQPLQSLAIAFASGLMISLMLGRK